MNEHKKKKGANCVLTITSKVVYEGILLRGLASEERLRCRWSNSVIERACKAGTEGTGERESLRRESDRSTEWMGMLCITYMYLVAMLSSNVVKHRGKKKKKNRKTLMRERCENWLCKGIITWAGEQLLAQTLGNTQWK